VQRWRYRYGIGFFIPTNQDKDAGTISLDEHLENNSKFTNQESLRNEIFKILAE